MDLTKTPLEASPAQTSSAAGWDRRRILHLSGVGLATAFAGRVRIPRDAPEDGSRVRTRRAAGRLLDAITSADTAAIWSMFAPGGFIQLPFLGVRISDGASLEAQVGPLLADLTGLEFRSRSFVDLDDVHGVIVKFKGRALVASTGKPYDQTYISQVRVNDKGKIASYTEYFDTAVLNEALTP
jgi:uncharacterized protein